MENRERAEFAAAEWIARHERDNWTEADEASFSAWVAASVDNRVAWLRLHTAWQHTHRLKALITTAQPGKVPSPQELRLPFLDVFKKEQDPTELYPEDSSSASAATREAHSSRRAHLALAASLLLGLGAALVWHSLRASSYHTEIGALQTVPLSDGSRVTLNTDTAIRVDVTPTERRINLEQGEAYFEVAKDPARPFVVKAGDKRIIAVGTQFSVRRERDEVRVLVTEGVVRFEGVDGSTSAATASRATQAILPAGSIARAAKDGMLVRERPVVEVEQLLSWRSGYLVFDKTPLAAAVAEFNRYNTRKIVIEDPQVAAIPVGGNFRATNVEGFVRLIAGDLSITATQENDRIILSAPPPPYQ